MEEKSKSLGDITKNVHHVIQGEYFVSDDPSIVLTTILGSCVATCLCDPVARVGGINHFLLPNGDGKDGMEFRYGILSMELLVNGLLKMGASKSRLEAKIFGGAAMNNGLARIGESNSQFAVSYLSNENIKCLSKSLGGINARRVRYVPTTGQAQQMLVSEQSADELSSAKRLVKAEPDVTLF